MALVSIGEERGRCFTIEYVMPVSTQLASESTVNVLSRCLQLSSLGHGLGRAEQGRAGQREEAGDCLFPKSRCPETQMLVLAELTELALPVIYPGW